MDSDDSDSFDDPHLKAAVSRAWASEAAPAALRNQLTQMLGQPPASVRIPRRNPWFGLAAAAAVILAIGLIGYRMSRVGDGAGHGGTPRTVAAVPLATSLASDLITTHDFCCSHPDHHMPGLPHDDFPAIGSELHHRLGWPVLSAALHGSGWVFAGASVCPVGTRQSAHLVYKNTNQFISVFSLPDSARAGSGDTTTFEMVQADHPIAAFAQGTGLYCVVGNSSDGSLTLQQVRALRDELRPSLAAANESPARVTVADGQP